MGTRLRRYAEAFGKDIRVWRAVARGLMSHGPESREKYLYKKEAEDTQIPTESQKRAGIYE